MPSSVVSKFYYNANTNTLRIIFVTGMIYDYKNVPEKVYRAMKESFSKGTYFNQYIKGKYEFEKIEK
ncbi:MAG: KTSC domain-containing protein [Chitinophagaceae bacterium]